AGGEDDLRLLRRKAGQRQFLKGGGWYGGNRLPGRDRGGRCAAQIAEAAVRLVGGVLCGERVARQPLEGGIVQRRIARDRVEDAAFCRAEIDAHATLLP